MSTEQLLQFLRARPFAPFRLYLQDGQAFDIRHPELVVVEEDRVILGVVGAGNPTGDAFACTGDEIARVESLAQPTR